MFVQACINGRRANDFHPRIPSSIKAMAEDAVSVTEAGATEIHVHPRGADGRESLFAVDETMSRMRSACPGTLLGISTGAWIEGDEHRTRQAILAWKTRPDYASANLSEPDAPGVMELLRRRGIGIEAGLASVADAERLVGMQDHDMIFRILIELDNEAELHEAMSTFEAIAKVLETSHVTQSILLHGYNDTVWPFVEVAKSRRFSTRVGFEDGKLLPDGRVAASNAALVAAAVAIYR